MLSVPKKISREHLRLAGLNGFALVFYFSVSIALGFPGVIPGTVFSTPDTNEYLLMGQWLFGDPAGICSDTRPFIFPLLVLLLNASAGSWGIWAMNFLFWLAAVNMLYLTAKRVIHPYLALLGSALFAVNIGLIAATFYALTETFAVFLIILAVGEMVKIFRAEERQLSLFYCTLIFSVLGLVKPLYIYFFYTGFAISLWVLIKKNRTAWVKKAALLAVACTLFVVQLLIMKNQFETFAVSRIGAITFQKYYYAKFYAEANGIPYDLAKGPSEEDAALVLSAITGRSAAEISDDLIGRPGLALETYKEILFLNLNAPSTLIKQGNNPKLLAWSYRTSLFYVLVHSVFAVLLLIHLFLYRGDIRRTLLSLALAALFLLIILSSGISYWQGDRLILPSLPVWIVLYAFTAAGIFNKLKPK